MRYVVFAGVLPALFFMPLTAKAQTLPANTVIDGYFKRVDGDTIKRNGISLRIVGIDAPERSKDKPMFHFYGRSNAYMDSILKYPLRCVTTGHKTYKRYEASCTVIGIQDDVGALMVLSGYAVEWKKFSKGIYSRFEQSARFSRRGLWSEMSQSWR